MPVQNTQTNTSDGAVGILTFVETVRFLRKDSAKTLSPNMYATNCIRSTTKIVTFSIDGILRGILFQVLGSMGLGSICLAKDASEGCLSVII